jgi:hypothetical protein
MNHNIDILHLPRYREIPNIGLYLEQTIEFINQALAPLRDITITSSMISNYVKHGYIERPIKKRYSAEQIASLLFMVIAKQVLSMENIAAMFELQKESSSDVASAYDYFCDDFEAVIKYMFETTKEEPMPYDKSAPLEKRMLRSTIIAVSQIIYLSHCFADLQEP